jgi:hypothetical protein
VSVRLQEHELEELARVFAECFPERAVALTLVAKAGIRPGILAPFADSALAPWWHSVLVALSEPGGGSGLETLLRAAAAAFPANPYLRRFATPPETRRDIEPGTGSIRLRLPPNVSDDRLLELLQQLMRTPAPDPREPPRPERSSAAPVAAPRPGPAPDGLADAKCLRWIHLSDLHFNRGGPAATAADRKVVLTELARDVLGVKAQLGSPQFLFITGDVAYRADPHEEYPAAQSWIQAVLDSLGLQAHQVFLVPGNHDADRARAVESFSAREFHAALRRQPTQIEELLKEPRELEPIWAKFSGFTTFSRAFGSPAISAAQPFWTQPIHCAMGPVVLVGLNTALLSFDDSDASNNLALGLSQLHQGIQTQPSDCLLLVLAHHPPEWLVDGGKLETLLGRHAHILLCGHIHQESARITKPLDSPGLLRLMAGAAHDASPHAGQFGYSWAALDGQGLAYYPRVWVADQMQFVPDRNKYPRMDTAGCVRVLSDQLPGPLSHWLAGSRAP